MYDLGKDQDHWIPSVFIQTKNLNFKNQCLALNQMTLRLIKLVLFLLKCNNYQVLNYLKVRLMYSWKSIQKERYQNNKTRINILIILLDKDNNSSIINNNNNYINQAVNRVVAIFLRVVLEFLLFQMDLHLCYIKMRNNIFKKELLKIVYLLHKKGKRSL